MTKSTGAGAAALTGGAGGVSLAAFAQTFDEPYRTGIAIAAPAFASLIQLGWPSVQAGIVWIANEAISGLKGNVVRWKIDRAIQSLERQRKDRPLSPVLKAKLDAEIVALKLARIDVTVEGAKPNRDADQQPDPPLER